LPYPMYRNAIAREIRVSMKVISAMRSMVDITATTIF